MNEVSIIINGVRYDAVVTRSEDSVCDLCDILEFCEGDKHEALRPMCCRVVGDNISFIKSTKSFEP